MFDCFQQSPFDRQNLLLHATIKVSLRTWLKVTLEGGEDIPRSILGGIARKLKGSKSCLEIDIRFFLARESLQQRFMQFLLCFW